MPRPWTPEAGPALRASPRNRNAHQHFTRDIRRAILYWNLKEKCRGPDWAQNADTHFVRACAIKMHVHMSQETSEEPLFTEIYGKHPAAQIGPKTTAQTLCEPAQSKCMSRFHKSHFLRKFTGKMPRPRLGPERRHTLCVSLRRNACPHVTRDIRRATL